DLAFERVARAGRALRRKPTHEVTGRLGPGLVEGDRGIDFAVRGLEALGEARRRIADTGKSQQRLDAHPEDVEFAELALVLLLRAHQPIEIVVALREPRGEDR